ncbi:MAG: hypothetical protein ACRD68_06380 [Pyrinomonadaceae bacterium]
MDRASKSKWQVRAAALVIFLFGAAAGVLAPRVYYGWLGHDGPRERGGRFTQMLDRLRLSAEQRAQVEQILGDTRGQLKALREESEPRVREIQRQADERLQKVMTPEQWRQFQQEKEEMRRRGRRGRGGRGDRGDGPPPAAER